MPRTRKPAHNLESGLECVLPNGDSVSSHLLRTAISSLLLTLNIWPIFTHLQKSQEIFPKQGLRVLDALGAYGTAHENLQSSCKAEEICILPALHTTHRFCRRSRRISFFVASIPCPLLPVVLSRILFIFLNGL